MTPRRAALLAAAALVAAPAGAADQPPVLAAWSQVFGATAVAPGATPPRVEMRFVLGPGGDCGGFAIERRFAPDGVWSVAPPARPRGGAALAVEVCAAPMATDGQDWREARLLWRGTPARLTSLQPLGDSAATVGKTHAPGPADAAEVRLWGAASIGTRRPDGELVAVSLGDTGCRGEPVGAGKPNPTPADAARLARDRQACDPASWPLAELAVAAAALAPDLAIHVGDYRYFLEDEVPAAESGWLYWQKDFFPAAQPLLLAAPLVAARGNHEACGPWGFGDGYFQLFGPEGVTDCATAADPMPPEAFDVAPGGLAAGGAAAHRFVVIDTNDDAAQGLTARYRAAMALTRAEGAPHSAWWVSHIPAITLVDYDGTEHTGDPELQVDLAAAPEAGDLEEWFCGGGACRPSQILLGHQHLFQRLEFPATTAADAPWRLPRHVVVGHGGTRIDDASPAPAGAASCRYDGFDALGVPGDAAPAGVVETVTRHGVVVWRRSAETLALPAGWTLEHLWAGPAPPAARADAPPPACDR